MKAEINNENKAKFFALYLGQMVEYPEIDDRIVRHKLVASGFEYLHLNYKRKVKGCIGNEISFSNKNTNHNSNALNAKLELKPLSQISDEDKEHAYWLVYPITVINIDFLRSKGYALPWMGLSVEEMVEYGWIRLKRQ